MGGSHRKTRQRKMDNEDHNMETKRGKETKRNVGRPQKRWLIDILSSLAYHMWQVETTLDTNYTGQDNLERLSYKKFILLP